MRKSSMNVESYGEYCRDKVLHIDHCHISLIAIRKSYTRCIEYTRLNVLFDRITYNQFTIIYLICTVNIFCRGIRLKDYDIYNPVVRTGFHCISTGKSIPIERLNDNYCDCIEDGSDEPETNACANGVFYCSYQTR